MMYDRDRVSGYLKEMQHHLFNELAPFWLVRGVDKEYGGYLTYLDQNGDPTGETLKTLICQTRRTAQAWTGGLTSDRAHS